MIKYSSVSLFFFFSRRSSLSNTSGLCFFLPISTFTAGKSHCFCCHCPFRPQFISQTSIPISPQTFTAVIYHIPVLSTCSLSLCWKKPSLWFVPSLLLLLLIASSSSSLFSSSFSQAVDCIPLSPQWTRPQQRKSNFSQRLKLMLLLYTWIIREYIKRKKYRLHTMI